MRNRIVVATAFSLVATASGAQTMPGDVHAPIDPVHAVDSALGDDHAVQRQAARNGRAGHNWVIPLRTVQGRCYEVVGIAVGSARVVAQVYVRRARVGEQSSLASSTGDVSRARFCAELPGPMYSLAMHADGPTQWAFALHEVAPEAPAVDPDIAQRERLMSALANNAAGSSASGDGGTAATDASSGSRAAPGANCPVGGAEQDYPGNQLRAIAGRFPGALPVMAARRENIGTNQSRDVPLQLNGGQCVVVAAAGVPSVADVDIEIADPAGHRVAQDTDHHGVDSVRYCASYTGTYHASVRVFAGSGIVGIQAFEVP